MSEKQSSELPKIKELEKRIESLRCALFLLIIVVILLSSYAVLLMNQALSNLGLASFGILPALLLVILLLASICITTAAGKYSEKEVSSLEN